MSAIWYINTLKVYGSNSFLESFYEFNKGEPTSYQQNHLSFNKSLPLIHPLKSKSYYDIEVKEESFDDDDQLESVKEAIKVWGCKWDTTCYDYKREKDYLEYEEFVTSLNPPIQWIINVSQMNPSLRFNLSAISIEKDEWIKAEWINGSQQSFQSIQYSKHMYEQDDGDKIADKIVGKLKADLNVVQELLQTNLTFMQWLEKDTDDLKESILCILDEAEAYDYVEYLFERIKERLNH